MRRADTHQPGTRMSGALYAQLAHCLDQPGHRHDADRAAITAVECERAAGHLRAEASAVEMLGLFRLHRWDCPAAYERFAEAKSNYARITSGQEGAEDLPRALAPAGRRQGRALRGMGRLTDLAETLHEAGRNTEALTRITEAERLLDPAAIPNRHYLTALRERCQAAE
ncbi:hypothetical protein ACWEWD_19385 [Streptomyces tendae]